MKRVLQPVLHRDSYTTVIEREILAWMNEAFFAPLLRELAAFNVPVSAQYQAIKFDEFGTGTPTRTNEKKMEMYDDSLGGLGLKRGEMPQIPPEAQGALINFLAARDITFEEMNLRPGQLKPTQEGFYPEAVERARQFFGEPARALLVSKEGYLLDGHHRWTAYLLHAPNEKLRCFVFNRPVRTLMKVFGEFPSVERQNAEVSAVAAALQSGRIHYADGVFSGKFSAAISRELRSYGANFDRGSSTFSLPVERLPVNMKSAIFESATQAKALHETIVATLNAMQANIPTATTGIDLNRALTYITDDLGRQFTGTTSGIESISVQPKFTPAMREEMNKVLTNNLDLSIKNFASERLPELRARVEENVLQGMRTDRLAKIIESEFGVDKRKAEFLADQEAGLVTAKYRQVRYSTLGVKEYIWQTAGDVRVREGHKALNGRRFSFSNPPVCDPATGRRCNPGEDYRCRCVPRPIVVFGDVETGAEDAA